MIINDLMDHLGRSTLYIQLENGIHKISQSKDDILHHICPSCKHDKPEDIVILLPERLPVVE